MQYRLIRPVSFLGLALWSLVGHASLEIDAVWKGGVWNPGVWADDVWYEIAVEPEGPMGLTLDCDFAGDKSLLCDYGPTITMYAPGERLYVGSDGQIKTATFHEARFWHEPDSLQSLGLYVERAQTNLIEDSIDFEGAKWLNTWAGGVTLTPFAATSPSGNTDATQIARIDGNDGIQYQFVTLTAGSTSAESIYVKNVDAVTTQLILWDQTGGSSEHEFSVNWTGSVPTYNADKNVDFYTIQPYQDDWYRLTIAGDTDAANTSYRLIVQPDFSGSGTGSVYIWQAQVEDAAGYASTPILTSNKLLQTEDLSTTWANTWNGGVTITANAAVAPDGATTAELIERIDAADGVQQAVELATSTDYTLTVYLKDVDTTDTRIGIYAVDDAAWVGYTQWFWLPSGEPRLGDSLNTTIYPIPSPIAVGNGWWRVTAYIDSSAADGSHLAVIIPEVSGSGTEGVYAWGPNLHRGIYSNLPYIKNTTTLASARTAEVPTTGNLLFLDTPNSVQGTWFVDAIPKDPINGSKRFFQIDDGANANGLKLVRGASLDTQMVRAGGAGGCDVITGPVVSVDQQTMTAFAYQQGVGNCLMSVDGVAQTPSAGTFPFASAPTTLDIGHRNGGLNTFDGIIGRIRYYNVPYNSDLTNNLSVGGFPESTSKIGLKMCIGLNLNCRY